MYDNIITAPPGGVQELNARHEVGGGVFKVTWKTVSFTIVLLGGQLQDLANQLQNVVLTVNFTEIMISKTIINISKYLFNYK